MAVLGSLTMATTLYTSSFEMLLVVNILMHCAPVTVSIWLVTNTTIYGEDQSGRVGR